MVPHAEVTALAGRESSERAANFLVAFNFAGNLVFLAWTPGHHRPDRMDPTGRKSAGIANLDRRRLGRSRPGAQRSFARNRTRRIVVSVCIRSYNVLSPESWIWRVLPEKVRPSARCTFTAFSSWREKSRVANMRKLNIYMYMCVYVYVCAL